MAKIDLKPQPPKEAIDYFRKKGYKVTFDWHEMWREEHAYHFTVAKATSIDLLQDIRQSVDQAVAEGITFNEFKKQLKPTLESKGWWGKKLMVDPNTGEERLVQLGSTRRLKIIYDTNLRTAYAAGRWEQVQRTKKTRPWLRYIAILDERTRHQHRQWHNTVLPADDPFWNDHYPPNGWRCRCTVQQLSDRDLKRLGLKPAPAAPINAPKTYINKKTGQPMVAPQGIDPAFAYNVGKARMQALARPDLDRPLHIPFAGNPIDLPMPPPRPIPKDALLPDGLSEEEYARRFLKEFGGDIGKPVIFTDALGEKLVISDDLFRLPGGQLKATKRGRHRHLLLMAAAIKNPDEIFWTWQEYPKGRMTLNRVYLTRWQGDEGTEGGFTMFDVSPSGWNGVTTFKTDDVRYLLRQRAGALAYRRTKK